MDKATKFWNNQARRYNSNDSDEMIGLLHKIEKYLHKEMSVLDFACGTGSSTLLLAEHVKDVRGIDISNEMIKIAKEKVENSSLKNIELEVITLEDLTQNDNSFDLIVAFNILHLLDDLEGILDRVFNLLKPGGLFISTTACMDGNGGVTSFFIRAASKLGIVPSMHFYTSQILEGKILSSGFKPLESLTINQDVDNLFLVVEK